MREITRLRRQEPILEARIRELENIICPGESHDYVPVAWNYEPVDGYGTFVKTTKSVCKKCRKTIIQKELD